MKDTILWTIGIVIMIGLGLATAGGAQDLVWLLVPGLGLLIVIMALSKFLR